MGDGPWPNEPKSDTFEAAMANSRAGLISPWTVAYEAAAWRSNRNYCLRKRQHRQAEDAHRKYVKLRREAKRRAAQPLPEPPSEPR